MKILIPILIVTVISFFTLWVTKSIDKGLSEQVAYEILHKQLSQEHESYCLNSVADKVPSSTLVFKLNKAGTNTNISICYGESDPFIKFINISGFKRTGFNEITANYEYSCGLLCSGLSECKVKEKSGGIVELKECKLKWAKECPKEICNEK